MLRLTQTTARKTPASLWSFAVAFLARCRAQSMLLRTG